MFAIRTGIGIGVGRHGALLKRKTLLERNVDVVEAAFYDAIVTTAPAWNMLGRYYINKTNSSRVRQNGVITKISFALNGVATGHSFYFQVWRKNGAQYDIINQTVNIFNLLVSNSVNVITLPTPLNVLEGDFLCIGGYAAGTAFTGIASIADGIRYENFAVDIQPTTPYDWDSKTSLANMLPLKAFMQAPLIVGIGDSIIAGHPLNYSLIEPSLVSVLDNQILAKMKIIDSNYIYQNMGIGSQTSTNIVNRFTKDVVNLKPKIALLNGGTNDVSLGIVKSTTLANFTTMLNACQSNNIIPVVLSVIPRGDFTDIKSRLIPDLNTDLKALIISYTNAIWIDIYAEFGQFRTGGDEGNLWNFKIAYDSGDHIHPNITGYAKIAELVDVEIKKKYKLV